MWWLSSMAELLVATGSGADSGVAGGGSAFSFSLSSVFFSASSFLFSAFSPLFSRSSPSSPSLLPSILFPLSLLSLLFSSSLFCPLSRVFPPFFFQQPSPVFIGKQGRANVLGRLLLATPSTTFNG